MKESQHAEWKETWRDEYLRWISGFANAEGGVLEIGRNDQGVVVGVPNAARLMEEIPNKVRDILGIMVEVNLREEGGKDWIEIRVEPYPCPVSYRGEYHFRSGSTKQELKGAALDQFLLKKWGRHWDGVPLPGFQAKDCGEDALQLFADHASRSGRMDVAVLEDSREAILENLDLVEGSYLKRAACLLFSKRTQHLISGAWIKIGFFVTNDDLRYQDEIRGSLFEQVEKTLEILLTKYLKAYISYEGLLRRETYLFPYAALREALLNAVVHKDYSSGIPIQISVYEDHIVFWNPGQLPPDWTLEKLLGKHPSCPFNPLLASAFFRAGYIESWGRGIEKIERECQEHGIDAPIYDPSMSGLMLTFQANPQHLRAALGHEDAPKVGEKVGEKVGDRVGDRVGEKVGETSEKLRRKGRKKGSEESLTPNQRQILSLLRQNGRLTARELAEEVGISSRKIEQNIARLKESGTLRRIGPDRGGSWEVLK